MIFIRLLVLLILLPSILPIVGLNLAARVRNKGQLIPTIPSKLSPLRRMLRRRPRTEDASERHLTILTNVLATIPEPLRVRLAERGVVIVAPKAAYPRNPGVVSESSKRHVAYFDSLLLEVVIPEWSYEPEWSAFYRDTIEHVEDAVAHEIGHALETVVKMDRHFLLTDADFIAAYDNDRRSMSLQQQIKENYFLQYGIRGREEVFAESIAYILGNNNAKHIAQAFPRTHKIIRKQLELYLLRLTYSEAKQETKLKERLSLQLQEAAQAFAQCALI